MAGDVCFAGKRFRAVDVADDAARAANGLVELGATDARLALLMRNDLSFVVASEAARLAGAVMLPINWHLHAHDVAYILEDSKASIVVAHADLWRKIVQHLPSALLAGLQVLLVATPEAILRSFKVERDMGVVPPVNRDWADLVAQNPPIAAPRQSQSYPLIYTSGTTGRPKGVQRLDATRPAPVAYDAFFEPEMCTLLAAPLYHSAPNRFAQGTFQVGGTLVLPARFDAENMLVQIEEYRVTTTFVVPGMLQRLLRLPEEIRQRYDLSGLRHVVLAGAPCAVEVKRAMIDWWGPVLYEYYGSTETSALTFATSHDTLRKPGTVGRVIPSARVAILNEQGDHCSPGVSGEIYGRRDDIPDFTYLNAPEAREEASHGDLVTVGDIGYLDDEGYLFISDRKSDMIISNGVNIYPAQIEAAILGHTDIADCAVFGIPDQAGGEAVAAIVQTVSGEQLSVDGLLAFLKQNLASYMLPKLIEQRQDFPRDEAGKIKKRVLRAPYWQDADRII